MAGCGSAVWHGPRGGDLGRARIRCGTGARRDPRGRGPGRVEQLLHRLTGRGLGRLAVLFLDHGMVNPPQFRGLDCRTFDSPWCFTSAKFVSSISANSPVSELTVWALSQLPSWIFPGLPLSALHCCFPLVFLIAVFSLSHKVQSCRDTGNCWMFLVCHLSLCYQSFSTLLSVNKIHFLFVHPFFHLFIPQIFMKHPLCYLYCRVP
jgi:hypothetical protein